MNNDTQEYKFYETVEMDTVLMTNLKTTVFSTNFFKADSFMFIYVVSGNMSFFDTKYSSLGEVNLKPGSCMMMAPNSKVHNVQTDECDLRCIVFSPELLKHSCNFLSKDLYSVLTQNDLNLCNIPFENMFCLENLCEEFTNCIRPEEQVQFSKNILSLILHHFAKSQSDEYATYPTIVKKILSILNFMQNIMDGIPPAIYELGYSKSYICRIFKKYVGVSITNYITDMKLKHSIFILHKKNLSISEVCEELHYESVPYFTKIFKKKYGITPAKFRNQIQD